MSYIAPSSAVEVRCPGTFGEFVQGKLGDLSFLVTAPVNRYSTTTYTPAPIGRIQADPKLSKVRKICAELASLLEIEFQGFLEVESEIPHGKGLASSSADIIGAGSALLHAAGVPAARHAGLLEFAARRVEPTDGVMHAGVVCFAQHVCRLIEPLGTTSYEILGCVLPGEVDTCDYDSSRIAYSDDDKREFAHAVELAHRGVATGDLAALGQAATMSAVRNQPLLPKPLFERVRQLAQRRGAAGIVVAHSGTAIGLLLPRHMPAAQRQHLRGDLQDLYGCEAESFLSEGMGPIARRCSIAWTRHAHRHHAPHHASNHAATRRLPPSPPPAMHRICS